MDSLGRSHASSCDSCYRFRTQKSTSTRSDGIPTDSIQVCAWCTSSRSDKRAGKIRRLPTRLCAVAAKRYPPNISCMLWKWTKPKSELGSFFSCVVMSHECMHAQPPLCDIRTPDALLGRIHNPKMQHRPRLIVLQQERGSLWSEEMLGSAPFLPDFIQSASLYRLPSPISFSAAVGEASGRSS